MSASTYVGGETTVNNQSGSSFGAGWTLEGLERLYLQPSGDALVLQGDGSSAVFRNFGEGPVLDLALFWRDPLDAANVHLGSAGGGFLPAQLSEAGFQVEPGSYAFMGDFNQDFIPDLLGLTDPGTHAGQVYVLLGKGDGTFQRPIRSGRTFSSCGNRAFGDLNGDSLTDIIIRSDFVHPTPQETMVLFGNGDGTFRNVSRVVNGPFGTTIADFDQDSINDLMGGNYIYYGNGDGTFQPPVSTGEWPYYSSSSSADLNGDEIPDLIVNDPGPPTMPPYPPTMLIHVALNNGNGTFGPATTYETPRGARAVFDSNGDSHADLVCAHIESNSVTVLLGNGDGTFQAGIVSPGIPEPIRIAPADFTGDGVMDLGITRNASLIYYIARGNGNGTFTIIDQVDEMHGIPVVANLNGDFRGPGFIAPPGEYSRLVPNTDGTFTRILKDGTQIHFNANGFHTSTVDRNGNVTSYAYNPDGTLASITDPVNLVTSFSYNGSRLSSIQDPAGRTTSFAINGSGDLVQITNPDQTTVQFEYSDARFPHQMTARFDSKGNRTEYSYNFAGRFASSTAQSAAGPVVRSLAPAQLKGLVDPVSGQGTEGNPAPTTRQAEVVATFTDANNHSTTYRFDDFGNPIEIVDALARTTTWVRDGEGNAVRITRPNGAVSTMTYDDWGNLLTETDETIGATTTFTYEPNFNQITSVTDPRGKTTTINYDQRGNAIGITDDVGTLTEIVYSPNGLISSVTSALGQPEQRTTSFGYNPLGNLITATNPLLEATTFDYDNAGNVSVSTNAKNQTTLFIHNGMNRIESLQDADLKLTQFGYDFNGNLESVTDANQHTTIFTYDQSNRLTSTTNPLLATDSYTYDPAGNLISILTRKGETISYEYDAADQLLHKTLPGSQVTSFGYNSAGNVTSVVDPDSAVQMVYDPAGRLTSTTASSPSMPAQTIGYTYDLNGNRLTMTDPQDGVTDYVYDALNRPTSIENPSHQTTTFGYDRLSRRTTLTHHNGVVSTYTYDGASQLLSLVHQLGGLTVNSAGYVYDSVGNRTSKTDNSGTATYSYDTVNRLIEALNPLPFNPLETYIYDPLGNRTDSNQNGLSTFNEANRLLEDASFVYQYDANGNMTRRTSKSSGLYSQFVYDVENQLTQVIREDGSIVNYHYDGLGRRIEKEVAGVITRYVYDSEDILLELDSNNNIVARYTHGPGIDEPLIIQKAGQSHFYHADGLGSITDITDQSGNQAQAYVYSTFGQMAILNPAFSQPYAFTAREFDPETGLHYCRARYYDPASGRFVQQDPERSINKYSYANNNPILFIDPEGRTPILLKKLLSKLLSRLLRSPGKKAGRELGGDSGLGAGEKELIAKLKHRDLDGDGTPDLTDPDIDGDGVNNWEDPDRDGDGIPMMRILIQTGQILRPVMTESGKRSLKLTLAVVLKLFALYVVAYVLIGFAEGFFEGYLEAEGAGADSQTPAQILIEDLFDFSVIVFLSIRGIREVGLTRLEVGTGISLGAILAGLFVGLVIYLCTYPIEKLTDFFWRTSNLVHPALVSLSSEQGWTAILMLSSILVLAPLSEELFFRGFLQNAFRPHFGRWVNIILVNAVFGAIHISPGFVVYAFVAGSFLSVFYERRRSLIAVTSAHAAMNGVATLMYLRGWAV